MREATSLAATIVTVDLRAIADNWRAVSRLVAPARCAAVVKADAYGLGVGRVAPVLADAGCRVFFVATIAEAAEARALVPAADIYVLDGLVPGSGPTLAAMQARPVLGSLAEVREWADFCRASGIRYAAALHVDSGMNRLGLEPDEIDAVLAELGLLEAFTVDVVMSHLASSDDANSEQNGAQRAAFVDTVLRFPGLPRSLAASGGILLGREYDFDLVRPGLVLYGGQPSTTTLAPMISAPVEPVVRVEARVLQVRSVERGQRVGYAAAWTAPRRSQIATVALGYADGVPRTASVDEQEKGARIAFQGRTAPLVGRVSMDLVTVDVTEMGEGAPRRGDLVEVIGPTISLGDAARSFGTIPWEVLTRLSRRAVRAYIEEASARGKG